MSGGPPYVFSTCATLLIDALRRREIVGNDAVPLVSLRREGVAVHVGDGDDRTFFGEQVRNGLSDPMCASSDECRLALELIVHRFPGALIDAQNRSAAAIIASSPNPVGQRPAKGRSPLG